MTERICQAFFAVAEFLAAKGHAPIKGKVVEERIGETWVVVVNGTDKVVNAIPEGCMGANVRPVECCVFYNGWLAGMFNPYGGSFVAGTGANETTFLAAVTRAARGPNGGGGG